MTDMPYELQFRKFHYSLWSCFPHTRLPRISFNTSYILHLLFVAFLFPTSKNGGQTHGAFCYPLYKFDGIVVVPAINRLTLFSPFSGEYDDQYYKESGIGDEF